MTLQLNNGLKFGLSDKQNNEACRQIVDILAKVIRDAMKGYLVDGNFLALSEDASEAKKTSEEKELVFGKILVNGKNGFVLCIFLLKCQSLKEFGVHGNGTDMIITKCTLKLLAFIRNYLSLNSLLQPTFASNL